MSVIRPGEVFPIVRQLGDPADTGTYYVQAVVRNSRTGTTIQTINLTDGGNQRFTGSWTAIQDSSGQGLYVDITTTVYTDSGYTSVSDLYTKENIVLLVDLRWGASFRGFGGGGDVSYTRIRNIVREELDKTKFPEAKEVDFSEVLGAISSLSTKIQGISFPETDLSDVLVQLGSIRAIVSSLPTKLPEQEQLDLSPVMSALDRLATVSDVKVALKEAEENMSDKNKKLIDTFVGYEMKEAVKAVRQTGEEMRNLKLNVSVPAVSSKKESPLLRLYS